MSDVLCQEYEYFERHCSKPDYNSLYLHSSRMKQWYQRRVRETGMNGGKLSKLGGCKKKGKTFATIIFFLVTISLTTSIVILHIFDGEVQFWGREISTRTTCEIPTTTGFISQPFSAYPTILYLVVATYIFCCSYFDYHTWIHGVALYSIVRDEGEAEIIEEQVELVRVGFVNDDSGSGDEDTIHTRLLHKLDQLELSQSPVILQPLLSVMCGTYVTILFLVHFCSIPVIVRGENVYKMVASYVLPFLNYIIHYSFFNVKVSVTLLPIFCELFLLSPRIHCGRSLNYLIFLVSSLFLGFGLALPEVLALWSGASKYLSMIWLGVLVIGGRVVFFFHHFL
eukprot:TRINITY_DN1397_c0_g1_i5.p1 TRINITY_DN1397_c0_g1~~TRINITY_DN1397_c0_g1_i5.p1  ORF type:complete len:339 (+),score=41.61 TRINITY_DN1397_c0_g1_i5:30-1046(+)